MFTVKYGDDYLTDYVRFLTVNRGVASSNNLTTEETSSDGVTFLYAKRGSKEISLTFNVIRSKDVNTVRRTLAKILSTTEPKHLVFSDEPNYYYNAIPTGELTFTDNGSRAEGSVVFFVADGVAHRTDRITLNDGSSGGKNGTITNNSDGSITAVVINNGTKKSPARIKLTNNDENGFFGLVTEKRIFAMGNPEEDDGFDYTQSETFLNATNATGFANLTKPTNTVSPLSPQFVLNGTTSYSSDGLRLTSKGSGTNWHGGAVKYVLPADSEGVVGAVNFKLSFNIWFWAGAMGQTGLTQIILVDENDTPIGAYQVHKSDNKTNNAVCKFWTQSTAFKEFSFQANNGESNQSKPNKAFNQKTGGAYIIKEGSKLTFYYNGSTYSKTISNLESVSCKAIYVCQGQYASNSKFMSHMSVRSLTFQKNKVEKWKDVANRYTAGSEVTIDSEDLTLVIDETYRLDEMIIGSDFIELEVGENTLEISQSSWNSTPATLEISWEELHL